MRLVFWLCSRPESSSISSLPLVLSSELDGLRVGFFFSIQRKLLFKAPVGSTSSTASQEMFIVPYRVCLPAPPFTVWVYAFTYAWVPGGVMQVRPASDIGVFLKCSLPHRLRQGLLLILERTVSASRVSPSHLAPGIP